MIERIKIQELQSIASLLGLLGEIKFENNNVYKLNVVDSRVLAILYCNEQPLSGYKVREIYYDVFGSSTSGRIPNVLQNMVSNGLVLVENKGSSKIYKIKEETKKRIEENIIQSALERLKQLNISWVRTLDYKDIDDLQDQIEERIEVFTSPEEEDEFTVNFICENSGNNPTKYYTVLEDTRWVKTFRDQILSGRFFLNQLHEPAKILLLKGNKPVKDKVKFLKKTLKNKIDIAFTGNPYLYDKVTIFLTPDNEPIVITSCSSPNPPLSKKIHRLKINKGNVFLWISQYLRLSKLFPPPKS